MIEIRPKGTVIIADTEKLSMLVDAGIELTEDIKERVKNISAVTSADKKVEICKRIYQAYDPWTFDGDEKDVIINTIIDPFAAIEYLLDTIDSILG